MKIAIIVRSLTDGGAERVAAMWANGFVDRGNDVAFVMFDSPDHITYKIHKEVKLECIETYYNNKFLRTLEKSIKLHSFLKREQKDIVIDVIPTFWKRIAMIGTKSKKISTEHNSFERPDNATHKFDKINKIHLNRLYDHVTVLTQADKDVIGTRLKHVTVLPNPLSLEPVKTLPPKHKIVLGVGRINDWHYKGFDILIKAWAQISPMAKGWKLQIAGGTKGNELSLLTNLCKEQNVMDTVDFLGFRDDVKNLYQEASVFVLSSRYEGFGLVLIEAMSQGCACIACDYKGRQKEIITSDDLGITCEPDNVKALADALISLINDEKKRIDLAQNAIARSKDFMIDRVIDNWEKILKDVQRC